MANEELLTEIEAVFEKSRKTYGSPRVYKKLKDKVRCSENRIARLMRLRGLKAKQAKRYKATTKRNRAHPVAPNLLKRDFRATTESEMAGRHHLHLHMGRVALSGDRPGPVQSELAT
jgi:putative transposase